VLLELESVEKSYRDSTGEVPVLRGVSLDVKAGQTVALTGESGSGKSTLMHIAGGLDLPDAGAVRVSGHDLTKMTDTALAAFRRTEVALVFQQFNLIPSMTVGANVSFQAALSGQIDTDHIDTLIRALGLGAHLNKYPEALSGGQQQRVAIARALAAKPKLMLADEPTGNLDEATAQDVMGEMLQLVARTGAALMIVTHSPAIAAQMDRQLHLRNGVLE